MFYRISNRIADRFAEKRWIFLLFDRLRRKTYRLRHKY